MQNYNTISYNLSAASAAAKVSYFRLLGIMLVYWLISVGLSMLAYIPVIGLATIVLIMPVAAGASFAFVKALRGQPVSVSDLFVCFSSKATFSRVLGGMLWYALKIIVCIIPAILAVVFIAASVEFLMMPDWLAAIIGLAAITASIVWMYYKLLEYMFTPFILIDHPEVAATDAPAVSKHYTYGIKGRLFGVYMLFFVVVWIVMIIVIAAVSVISVIAVGNGSVWGGIALALGIFALVMLLVICASVFMCLVIGSFYNTADAFFNRQGGGQYSRWNAAEYSNMYQQYPEGYPQYTQQPVSPQDGVDNGEPRNN